MSIFTFKEKFHQKKKVHIRKCCYLKELSQDYTFIAAREMSTHDSRPTCCDCISPPSGALFEEERSSGQISGIPSLLQIEHFVLFLHNA